MTRVLPTFTAEQARRARARSPQSRLFAAVCLAALTSPPLLGQQADVSAAPAARAAEASQTGVITLQDAIARAKANEPAFAAAVAANKVAAQDLSLAKAALLPSVVYHNQYLYTQPAHGPTQSGNASASSAASVPRFIANNGVHEYTSQGVVTETIGARQITAVSYASAAAALASAELEISRRGLVVTVVQLYFNALIAERRVAVAERALDEARSFTELTRHREEARESAHADVIKALLQQQQRERDRADAALLRQKATLDLAVLLFPDPHASFALAEFGSAAPLGSREELQAQASQNNAELKSALASTRLADLDVASARAAYMPDLSLNFNYGIDASEFAVHGPDGTRNLGYSATATLDIPVWDWFSTHDRIKQKTALRDSAKVALSAAQRRLIAQFDEFYSEASVARDQLQSLQQSAAAARESLRLTRLRYSAGEAAVLEVVDAESTLVGSEHAQEDGILRYQTALANLQLLTGTL